MLLRVLSLFLSVCIVAVVIFLPYGLGLILMEIFPSFSKLIWPEAPFVGIWLFGFGKLFVCVALYALWWTIGGSIYEYLKERRGE